MSPLTPAVSRFHAMGCGVHVVVVGGPAGLSERAEARIDELESLWSRFRPDSDISRCNAGAGHPVVVSPLTVLLVERAAMAWRATGGLFDPTVLAALEGLGYDRTFELVDRSASDTPVLSGPAPGCADVIVDRDASTVSLPAGSRFDPGGIGKGLAADLVAGEVLAAGATGVCVNLGGDLRVAGEAPGAHGWSVGIEDPYQADRQLGEVVLADQGMATSSRTYRSWERAGAQFHHLIDPATATPAWTDLASVTVVAAAAWWAEVLAKAAFIAGPTDGAAMIAEGRATGLMVDDGGFVHPLPGFAGVVDPSCSA